MTEISFSNVVIVAAVAFAPPLALAKANSDSSCSRLRPSLTLARSSLCRRFSPRTLATWRLLQCPACTNIILTQTDIEGEESIVEHDITILYPTARTRLPKLPLEIAKEYEATLKVRRISANACAVLARRALEAICKQQGATSGSLYQQLDSLLKSASIPPLLADIAHLGRQIGNLGAHFGKGEASDADVDVMLDFLETILEYLYVIPAKVASVKPRLTGEDDF